MQKLYNKKFWWVGNYKKIIGKDFMKFVNQFIDEITEYNYEGYWYTHEEVSLEMFIKLLLRKPIKILTGGKYKFKKRVLRYKDGMRISFIKPQRYYKAANKFINNILDYIAPDGNNIILDQFLLPFNLHRIDNYFDDEVRTIVVERDPRDVYILNKYIWGEKGISIPMPKEVNKFVEFYKGMRESEIIKDSNKVLRIRFEDLIYNYDSELKKIIKFLGFKESDHINKKTRFNPEISIKNTQLFRKEEYKEEIKIIEENLKDYLYDFKEKIYNNVNETVEF